MFKNILDIWNRQKKQIKFTIIVIALYFVCLGLFLSEYRLPDIIEFLIVCILYYLFWILVCTFIYKDPKIIEELERKILSLFYW